MIDWWKSSSGLCTGSITQWSILPVVIASQIGSAVSHSPQRKVATRDTVASMARTRASTSMPSGLPSPTSPMTSATGVPACSRSRTRASSSAGSPQTTIL